MTENKQMPPEDFGKAHQAPTVRLEEGHRPADLPLGHASPMWEERGHGRPAAMQGVPMPPPMPPGIGNVARAPQPAPTPPPANTEK